MRPKAIKRTALASILAFSLALPLVGFGGLATAAPANAGLQSPSEFTACVDRQKTAAVVILMDESKSVYGSDPQNNRLQGVQMLVDELADLATDHQAKVNVKLAGMGAEYKIRSSGADWHTLAKGSESEVSSLKESAASTWNGQSGAGYSNKQGTDIWSALDAVKQEFSSRSEISCRLLLFFKDGEDWQYYARDNSKVSLPEAQELRDGKKFHDADEIGGADICRNLGLADALRSADIYTVVAALGKGSPEKFAQLESLAVGTGVDGSKCGAQPGKGSFVRVSEAKYLQQDFANLLGTKADVKNGSLTFRLSPGLSSIRIVSSAITDSYKITPPKECSSNGTKNVNAGSDNKGTFGQAVNWNKTGYGASSGGAPSSVRVVIHHEPTSSDYSCWSGQWNISASEQTLSSRKFDANLKAVAKFSEGDGDNPVLFPGKSQKFKVILQRIDDPTVELEPEEINADLDYFVTGTLFDPEGQEIDTLFDDNGAVLPQGDVFTTNQTLSIDKGWPIGTYKVRLNLNIQVVSSNVPLNPMQTEIPIIVGNTIKAPTVIGPVVIGTISGSSTSHGTIKVQGGEKDACIDFSTAELKLTAAPNGVEQYKISGTCVTIPSGQTVDVPFDISPAEGSRANSVGAVDGTLALKAQLIESASTFLPMAAADFHAYQDAAPNDVARWILIVVFMVLSMLLAYVLLVIISKYVARFPSSKAVTELHLQSIAIPVKVTKFEIKSTSDKRIEQLLDDLDLPIFVRVEKNRKVANVSGNQIYAKSSGTKLASAGFAQTDSESVGFGGPSVAGTPENFAHPAIGLGLQNTWMLLFNPNELLGKTVDDNFTANAQLIVIIDANAPIEKKMQLVSQAESALAGPKLEKLVAGLNKPAEQKSTKKKKKDKGDEDPGDSTGVPTQAPFDPWGPTPTPNKPASTNTTASPNATPQNDPWAF